MSRKYELIVDNFAGGGGASTGIEMAVGRSPDVAINHDPEALAMHLANHPKTRHYATDVFDIDPRVCVRNQPVGLAWFSPDCTHHSKARGGKPIREAGKKSRSLAWVVVKWAERVRPRVIALENVVEFFDWGPVIPKVDSDGRPVHDAAGRPMFVPCPRRRGVTFRRWQRKLERLGYVVEWKELRACDYGAPTIRKRFFCIARCDGKPIVWPKPTHGDPRTEAVKSGKLLPWRCAADIIDWSLPCPSIFLTPEEAKAIGCKRPLKPNTMKRIAAGVKRYVLESARPFIVVCNHGGDWFRGRGVDQPLQTATASRDANGLVMPFVSVAQQGGSNRAADDPLNTITASRKDQNCLVAPFTVPRYGERNGQAPRCGSIERPVPTVVPRANGAALVAAFLAQHNGGMVGHPAQKPLSTLTHRCTQQQVVEATLAASFLSQQRTSNVNGGSGDPEQPVNCLTAGGNHVAEVRAFLMKYYGTDQDPQIDGPLHTITTKDRFGLVTVEGVDYEIVDIGMRMLTARELFRAQGFPDGYRIDVEHNGRPLPKSSQVRMCGNSVCPQLAAALVRANCPELARQKRPKVFQRDLVGV